MSGPSPIQGVEALHPVFPWREETTAPPPPIAAPRTNGDLPPGEIELRSGAKGPVTAQRHLRNALLYAAVCVVAVMPMLLGMSAGWQALGIGLFMPGAGFLAVGGAAILLFPLTLAVFWLSIVAWFWAGMVVAPIGVWLGSAVVAAAMVGDQIWAPAASLAPLCAAAAFGVFQYRGTLRRAADRERFEMRRSFYPASLAEVRERIAVEPAAGTREMTTDQLAALRYVIDRALQPVGQYQGYDVIDQFQPADCRKSNSVHNNLPGWQIQRHVPPALHARRHQIMGLEIVTLEEVDHLALTVTATFSEALAVSPTVEFAVSGANTVAATPMTRIDATHYTGSFVVGAGEPRNAPADYMHGYLSRDGFAPSELTTIGREEVRSYGSEILAGRVSRVTRTGGDLRIEVVETAPGPDCVTTSALTQPVALVAVPAAGVPPGNTKLRSGSSPSLSRIAASGYGTATAPAAASWSKR